MQALILVREHVDGRHAGALGSGPVDVSFLIHHPNAASLPADGEFAMKHRPNLIRAALLLVSAAGAVRADDSLAPETARRLKEATVYIKVAIGPLTISGSGFVIQSSGDSALIVTNQHVVTKPKVLAPGGFVPGLRGRDRFALMRIQQALAASEPVVSVVFNSGEPNEQTVKAEVLCAVDDPDIAVLKVASLRSAPRAIEYRRTAQPAETMPVFILGFPFGESLAANKANPNITIGKGSVSSIRKDKSGKVVKVQIDGALNPGNSGGPVVDGAGSLVGIAVQTIQGSNIGLTIPADEVGTMLEGSLGRPTIAVAPALNGGVSKYEIVVPVIDPLKKLQSASVQFVSKSVPADPSKVGRPQLASEPASRKVDLPLRGPVARVELPVDAKAAPPVKQVTVQASYVTKAGKTVYLDPQVIAVPAAVQVTTTTDGQGKTTTTITQETGPGGSTVRRQMTITRGGAPAASGGGRPSPYKLGDKVLVEWAGKTQTAEVVGLPSNGWIKVKFPMNGIELTPTLPPNQIKPAPGSETKKAAPGAALRVWSSNGGKFTIKAKFVALRDGSVTLEKEDGETVALPLARLGEADQKLARQLSDESEENPFASKPEED
jgi:S1-C subfamily serine protease